MGSLSCPFSTRSHHDLFELLEVSNRVKIQETLGFFCFRGPGGLLPFPLLFKGLNPLLQALKLFLGDKIEVFQTFLHEGDHPVLKALELLFAIPNHSIGKAFRLFCRESSLLDEFIQSFTDAFSGKNHCSDTCLNGFLDGFKHDIASTRMGRIPVPAGLS